MRRPTLRALVAALTIPAVASTLVLTQGVATAAPVAPAAVQIGSPLQAAPRAAAPALVPPRAARLGTATTPAVKPGKPVRVRELAGRRTATSKSFEMSDGTTQAVLSLAPLHFKDAKGKWQDIDTRLVAGSGEDGFVNAKNRFGSRFGKWTDRLLRFEAGGAWISLGVAGERRAVAAKVAGSRVTFPDVFGPADVRYSVSPRGVKEDIVLASAAEAKAAPEEFVFELKTGGLVAKAQSDGSIGFFRKTGDARPAFVMPAPFMSDSSKEAVPGQAGWSDKVTQTVTQAGGRTLVTLRPDRGWLTSSKRVGEIVIDPTIMVAPEPAEAQDAFLYKRPGAENSNAGSSPYLYVGHNGDPYIYRSLVRFDTSMIPSDATIRSADLNLHFAKTFSSETNAVTYSAHQVTSAWTEGSVTWNTQPTFSSALGSNSVLVDDTDTLSTSFEGSWKDWFDGGAFGGSLSYPPHATGTENFTWNARVPGEGNYKVEAHYQARSTRGTPTYVVTGDAGSTAAIGVNQTVGSTTSQWATLTGSHHFAPEKTAKVTMTRQAGTTATTPVADAVRFTEYSQQSKQPYERDEWDSYAIGSVVQNWVNAPATNYGFLLKSADESGASGSATTGGVSYQASEAVYGGETSVYPHLLVTYGEPGVTLNEPALVTASGPTLAWSKYVDPTPDATDDLVEYEIWRGCVELPASGCPAPAPNYFPTGTLSGVEQVGTVAADVLSFTDDSALASTETELARYRYWIVARTAADVNTSRTARAASNARVVTIPQEGRVRRVISGDINDITLGSAQPTNVLTRPNSAANRYWVQVGNSNTTYGDERGLFEFDTSAIPTGRKVTDARLELWQSEGPIVSGSTQATFDVHALTRDFVESQATWNKATSTITWTKPGGDFESTALASLTTNAEPKRLTFTSPNVIAKVQAWVDDLGKNSGFLVKARDEAASQQFLNIVAGEGPDTTLRPRLVIEHLAKNDAETIEANEVPERLVPGTIVTTPVTVTNPTTTAWPAQLQLSYRWTEPGSTTDITVSGERNYVNLGRSLLPGQSVKLDLPVRTPIQSDTGFKRLAYDLYLDLWNPSTPAWFSASTPLAGTTTRPTQGCAMVATGLLCIDRYVEDPTSGQLGLEKFLTYTGEETGGGPQLLANLYSGNVVWSHDAMTIPSIGPATFVRLAYNSKDASDSGAGYGVSVQPSTLTRLGSRLSVPSSANGSSPNEMTFIDGDGTTHRYRFDSETSTRTTYTRPAGVALDLTWERTAAAAQQWVFTRPDGTRFFFNQDTGLPTSIVDRLGNTLTFVHDGRGRLTSLKDASGRTTLTLGYDGTSESLLWVRDLAGRALKFTYNSTHQLVKLEDGGPFDAATGAYATGALVKSFQLGYTDTSVNNNAKLNSVKDPNGAETLVEYFTSTENSAFADWPKRYRDRRGHWTTFAYSDPDASEAKDIVAEVTDENGTTPSRTTYRMDGYGRTTSIKDANANADGAAHATLLGWDSDHNVIRLQEPNGAVSTWEFSPATGYPLKIRDAMAVKTGHPGIVLSYLKLTGAPGQPTVLTAKDANVKDPQGKPRKDTFTYNATNGNLLTVRNGLGYGPDYTYNADGTLATVKDARGYITTNSSYTATGYPSTITEPGTGAPKTGFVYSDGGQVLQVTDALGRLTTAEYDIFGRPTVITTPHDGTSTRSSATEYDLKDNVVKETAPNGAVTAYAYDAADNLVTKTLPDNNATGRKITLEYDALSRKIRETAPAGNATTSVPDDYTTRYGYDPVGQVVKVEAPFLDADGASNTAVTTYGYDLVGNKVVEVDPNKNATASTSDYTTKMVYDLNHRVTAIIDAAGYSSKNEYDAGGLLTAEIDQLGNRKRTVYDAAGQAVEVHVPHTPTGSATQDRVTKTTYDQVGNVTRVTRPSGSYDETVYDANNRPVQKKSAFLSGDANYGTPSSTYIKYDLVGQMTRQSDPTYATTEASAPHWTDLTYYPSGDVKTSTDPWQLATTYRYNETGQQISRTLKSATDDATRSQAWGFYPDGSMSSHSDTAAQQPVTVLDSHESTQFVTTGTWATVTGGTNTQGGNYRTHAAAAAGTVEAGDTATWKATPDLGGTFDVYVSCPVRTDSTTAATYTINHATGSSTKTINQRACTSSTPWVSLGNFTLNGGVTKTIVLKPSADGVAVADAVKLVATGTPPTRSFTYSYDANGLQAEVKDTTPNAGTDTYRTSYDGLGRPAKVEELKAGAALRTTSYRHDLNGNVASTDASRPASAGNLAASQFTGYTWDVRNLVAAVEAKATATAVPKDTWTYTYDSRAMLATLTKPNGNVTTATYHEDGLPRTLVEKTSGANGAQLVSSHSLKYTLDGDRTEDVEKLDQAASTGTLDQISKFAYTPTRKLASVTRTGADRGGNESYVYDAAGNITSQSVETTAPTAATTTATMTYDRNRLVKTVSTTAGVSTTRNHRYDVFGRSKTTEVGSQVVERYAYDGYDRIVRQQEWSTTGVHQSTKNSNFDPFDRTTSQTVQVTTQPSVSTRFTYLGLTDQAAFEEQTNTAGAYEVAKQFVFGSAGEKLSLVDTPVNDTTTKKSFFGVNPHGDVETLTDSATGQATSTYRYTAYGSTDAKGTTGDDAITGDPVKDADVVNPYRFNGKRFEGATGTYDMGFRDYDPGLNRFLTRDMYNGALNDLALGADPWNTNRYAFAGGNPISMVELDGHWGISLSAIADAASAVGSFVEEHKATIAEIAVGVGTGAACTLVSGGLGAAVCIGAGAAAASMVGNALREDGDHSAAGYAKSAGIGLLSAAAGGAIGKMAAPLVSKAAAPVMASLKGAAAPAMAGLSKAGGKAVAAARSAISRFRGGCTSFSGATVVLMADGTEKAIEDIKPGDQVIATDPDTGQQVAKEVSAVWVHDDTLLDLVVDGETITTTEDHPFYNVTDGEFQFAAEITPGDQVLTDDGDTVTVHGLDAASAHTALAYNLTVEGIHSYHVGQQHLLVHNVGLDECTALPDLPADVLFHYTDEAGAMGIRESGVIRAGMKNRVHLTDEMYSPDETANALFTSASSHAGRGSHVVALRVPEGTELIRGSQPNEIYTIGSLRPEFLYIGRNVF